MIIDIMILMILIFDIMILDIDIWFRCHVLWPQSNSGRLIQKNPDGVRRIYRRLCILSKEKRLKPQSRSQALSAPYNWYVMIAPESVPTGLERLQSGLELVDGNIKYALEQSWHLGALANHMNK